MKQYLLFDLDGTLTDPKVGITTCVQYALADFGIDEPDLDKLEPFIGPPLKDSFMEFYQMTEEQADHAIEKYRERFRDTGIFENELYGGIHDLLRTMKAAGMHMAVVSSKPTVFVERILKHFKLDSYFEVVLGSELDGTRVKKAQVIVEVLRKFFGDKPIKNDEIFMIGDRKYDIEGARTFHIESIGVTYGYGSMEELKEARADYIVQSVAELKKLLMREVDAKERMDEVHKAQQPGAKKPQNSGMKDLWRVLLPYLLFILARAAAGLFFTSIMQMISQNEALRDFIVVQQGEEMSMTGLASVVVTMLSYIVAGLFILRYARPMIARRAEEMKLTHLKPEPVKNYVIIAGIAIGSVISFFALIDQAGLIDIAASYREVRETPHFMQYLLSIFIYQCICSPIAEELMFRGIVYNGVKKFMTPKIALLMTTLFYGYYFGYSIMMFYGILIGLIITYAYEFFGDFRIAVGVHVLINLVFCLFNYTALSQTPILSWPACVAGLAVAGVGLFLMIKEKKVF